MGVLEKVRHELARHRMVEPGHLVIIGVSGGPDSIALLHILFCLKDELGILLHVAHLNHMFRGDEAKADAFFVAQVSSSLGVHYTIEERDVSAYARERGLSPQVAAREVRYDFFNKVLKKMGGSRLALGHHADDQAESVLLNILRGSGTKGLAGILPFRENLYIRPLLTARRFEIETYCRDNQLSFRIDSSNSKTIYRRNKIRRELIPLLEQEYSPGLVPLLIRLAELSRGDEEFLAQSAEKAFDEVLISRDKEQIMMDRAKLSKLPIALARRVIRNAWGLLRGTKNDLTFEQIENIVNRLNNCSEEKIFELPGGMRAWIYNGSVYMATQYLASEPVCYQYLLPVPGELRIAETDTRINCSLLAKEKLNVKPSLFPSNVALLDYTKVTLPLIVRTRQDGDVFVPFGLGKKVKLKKLLIDLKVPRHLRSRIPLVVEQVTGRIVWIAGIRIAEGTGIDAESTKGILLHMENGNSSNM